MINAPTGNETALDFQQLLDEAPAGFTIRADAGLTRVEYSTPYRELLASGLLLFGVVWFCITGFVFLASLPLASAGFSPFGVFAGLICVLGLVGIGLGIKSALTRYAYVFEDDQMRFSINGLERRILRSEVGGVVQTLHLRRSNADNLSRVQRMWAVDLEGRSRVRILSNGGRAQSWWLARLVAAWAQVPLDQEGPSC